MAGKSFRVKAIFEGEDRGASRATKGFRSSLEGLTSFIRDRFVFTLGDATNALRQLFGAIDEVGTLQSQTEALKRNLAAQGVSFDAYIAKLQEVSDGQIATADLIKSSSQALLLGIPADKIAELLEVARVSAIATGQSVSQAFNDIATGIGRASPLILDNLGLVVKLGEVYGDAAVAAGVTTEALTQQQKSAALLNEVLRIGADRVETFGDAQSKAAGAVQRATAQFADVADGFKKILAAMAFSIGSAVALILRASVAIAGGVVKITNAISEMAARVPVLAPLFSEVAEATATAGAAIDSASDSLRNWQQTFDDAMNEISDGTDTVVKLADAVTQQNEAVAESGPIFTSYAQSLAKVRGEAEETPDSLEIARDGFDTLGLSVERNREIYEEWINQQRRIRAELEATRVQAERTSSAFGDNLLGGKSTFSQLSGGTFSAPVNPLGKATQNILPWVKPNGL